MKKLLLAMLVFVGMASVAVAQTKKDDKAKEKTAATAKAPGHTKADGTPDMRYKENKGKEAAAPAHTKKDGTPDMRYKENKGKEVDAIHPLVQAC